MPFTNYPTTVTLSNTEVFGEEVRGFDVSDMVIEKVTDIEWVDGSNPVLELEITPEGSGYFEIFLSRPEGAVSDISDNEDEAYECRFRVSPHDLASYGLRISKVGNPKPEAGITFDAVFSTETEPEQSLQESCFRPGPGAG